MQLTKLSALAALIKTEVATGKSEIRFGDATNPNGPMDGVAIRLQPTLGGLQYRVCQVTSRGEGSGLYEMEPEDAAALALKLAEDYTRPHPNPLIQAALAKTRRAALSFYTVERK